jgi:hypothetical protein
MAAAGTNAYGGYDIVEDSSMYASGYGKARGWQVMAAFQNRKFTFCYAEPESEPANNRVRIGFDSQQWQVAIPVRARRDWEGTFEVDGQGGGNGGGNEASGTSAGGRAIAWLGAGEVDLMRNGSVAILSIGRVDYDFSLDGAAAAMLKIEECVQRRGQQTAQAAQPPVQPRPAARPQPQQTAASQVTATCSGHLMGSYSCKVTNLPPEPGYTDIFRVEDPARAQQSYLLKVKSDTLSEVWIRDASGGRWDYYGFWEQDNTDEDCIFPSRRNTKAIKDKLGQDAWNLCVKF